MSYESSFWKHASAEHQKIVETFDRNIEFKHPDMVSTDRLSPWSKYSKWAVTSVKYPQYTGPRVTNI